MGLWQKLFKAGGFNAEEYVDPADIIDGEDPYNTYIVEMQEYPNNSYTMRWEWKLVRRNTKANTFGIPTIHTINSGWTSTEQQGENNAKLAKEKYIRGMNAKSYSKEI